MPTLTKYLLFGLLLALSTAKVGPNPAQRARPRAPHRTGNIGALSFPCPQALVVRAGALVTSSSSLAASAAYNSCALRSNCVCMSCRRNLKKEKRVRNRVNAFRFKKGGFQKFRRFGGNDDKRDEGQAQDADFYSTVSRLAGGCAGWCCGSGWRLGFLWPWGEGGEGAPELPSALRRSSRLWPRRLPRGPAAPTTA